MEARCAKCGVAVIITELRSNGHSYKMKSGVSLADLCPEIIEQTDDGRHSIGDECTNLATAIKSRIERFHTEHAISNKALLGLLS
jgi:hypothetical protein